ncbi:MAG: hypothetical protein HFF44_05860 [Lawsonibacter sp.]|nr:hypothetical protein [Lawsonibacter sp.]
MKKWISGLLSLALCLSLCAPAFAAGTFSDVEGWAAPYVERAVSLGLAAGVGGGRFEPSRAVSYREYAVMLCGIRYQDETDGESGGEWWRPYCAVADAHGLWDGTVMADEGAWSTQGGQPVPRQAMAQMIYNYLQAEGKQLPSEVDKAWARAKIADLDAVDGRNVDAVLTCYSMELLSGTGSGFAPAAAMDRGQAAAVLCALYDVVTEGADSPAQTGVRLANGKAITEDNVREIINGLRGSYPEGMPWTNENNHYTSNAMFIRGHGCAAFAFLCSDTVFGQLPITAQHSDFDKIRAGDILRVKNDTHTVIVLEKRAGSVIVAEGNYNGTIHWDREITRQELEDENFYVRTRYPG